MKIALTVIAAILAGSLTAKIGLSFAPAIFTTYAGTAIVIVVMAISGLAINRVMA